MTRLQNNFETPYQAPKPIHRPAQAGDHRYHATGKERKGRQIVFLLVEGATGEKEEKAQVAENAEWWEVNLDRVGWLTKSELYTQFHYKVLSGLLEVILKLFCALRELSFKQAEWKIHLYSYKNIFGGNENARGRNSAIAGVPQRI